VLRIVLHRAWLNLKFPAVARPILPMIQSGHEPDARTYDVGEQLARLEKEYHRHDSPLLWKQIERDDTPQINLWPRRDSNLRR
jgi:hypothetical protein